MGFHTNLLLIHLSHKLSAETQPRRFFWPPRVGSLETEDAMYEFTVMLTLIVARVVVPVGLLLLIGELSRTKKQPQLRGM